jgi:hypothetical protein
LSGNNAALKDERINGCAELQLLERAWRNRRLYNSRRLGVLHLMFRLLKK